MEVSELCMRGIRQVIAQNVSEKRRKLGISQEALAEQCGLVRNCIQQLECMEHVPSLWTFLVLQEALQLDAVETLLFLMELRVHVRQELNRHHPPDRAETEKIHGNGTLSNYSYEAFQVDKPLYGIRAKDGDNVVTVAQPFSLDGMAVTSLAQKCTSLQLSPLHLMEVILDFMAEYERKFAVL